MKHSLTTMSAQGTFPPRGWVGGVGRSCSWAGKTAKGYYFFLLEPSLKVVKKLIFFGKKFFGTPFQIFFSKAIKGGHRFWKPVQNRVNKHLMLKSRDANYAHKY